jgi:hypothetical protein
MGILDEISMIDVDTHVDDGVAQMGWCPQSENPRGGAAR